MSDNRSARRSLSCWIASVGGIGYAPVAPGTAGSLAGLALVVCLGPDALRGGLAIALCAAMAIACIPSAERRFGTPDPGQIVIDEVVGMTIALWHVPHRWPLLLAGFLLFRLFDILKPPPLKTLERLPSPWGVLLDDVAAGVVTNLCLQAWLLR